MTAMSTKPFHPLIAAAKDWYDAGYCVVPTHTDGGKRPDGLWKQHQTERLPYQQLVDLLNTNRYTGIGIITGQVSGNVEMIELEAVAYNNGSIGFLRDLAERHHLTPLLNQLLDGCVELTPTLGLHTYARCSDTPIPGNLKLARQMNRETGQIQVLAETRGEGGFSVVAPTPGRKTHPHGSIYLLAPNTHPNKTPTFTGEQLTQLHWLFTQLDDMPTEPPKPTKPSNNTTTTSSSDLTSWEDWANQTTWTDILTPAGWTHMHSGQRNGHPNDTWCRPGKKPEDGPSATTAGEDGPLYIFSSSTTLPSEEGLSKFYVYAHYHHNDNMAEAARTLAREGYGTPSVTYDPLNTWNGPNPLHTPNTLTTPQPKDQDPDPTTWADLTWILTGERRDPPPPTHLTTHNGNKLFYTGRINGLFGDPETAKSWIAMSAITEALNNGEKAAYLDADHNGANEIATRLISLGAHPNHVANPNTFRIYEPDNGHALLDFVNQMLEWEPNIAAIDSLGEIIPMLGLKSSDNDDLTHAIRRILKPLAHTAGTCVITIDHLPKSQEARTSGYAIGGIAKKRAIDGSYFLCEATHPPAPGKEGKIRLTVEKDRHGHVREKAVGRIAGIYVLDSRQADTINWHIELPAVGADGKWQPTSAMEAVSRHLLNQPGRTAPSQNSIVKAVTDSEGFGASTVERAIAALNEAGCLSIKKVGRTKPATVTLTAKFEEFGGFDVDES